MRLRNLYQLAPQIDEAAAQEHYRNEQKYLCTFGDMQSMRLQLRSTMQRDPHAGPDGTYLIRSVYFDTPDNLCVRENEDGVDDRNKWRIRIYNASAEQIHLECKIKMHGMTRKLSCPLTREDYENLMRGTAMTDRPQAPLFNQFAVLQRTRGFRPAVIVQYHREPFVCRYGNVRITRDYQLESSVDFAHFFDGHIMARPVLPRGIELLEIKFDEYLPAWIRTAVQQRNMRQTSFSKYYLCRRYPLDGFRKFR